MKKIKKVLLLVLSVAVISFGLAGCGGNGAEEPPEEPPTSEHPSGEDASDEHPAGDDASSEHPAGEHPTSEHPQ